MCAEPQSRKAITSFPLEYVYLASDEWGNEIMQQVADETLDNMNHPLACVCVYEHAGWYLEYARFNGRTIIIGSANDQATFTEPANRFHALIRGLEVAVTTTRR